MLIAVLVVYLVALLATCTYALKRGGRTERRAAIALLIAVVATQIADAFGRGWQGPEYGIMAVDAALFVAFAAIAHRSERYWPIWIAAAQLVGLITHLGPVLYPGVVADLYRMTQPFWVFPILGFIAWGTWMRQRTTS
jgi:cytochrome bd-type quinol oxidase subunit 2